MASHHKRTVNAPMRMANHFRVFLAVERLEALHKADNRGHALRLHRGQQRVARSVVHALLATRHTRHKHHDVSALAEVQRRQEVTGLAAQHQGLVPRGGKGRNDGVSHQLGAPQHMDDTRIEEVCGGKRPQGKQGLE